MITTMVLDIGAENLVSYGQLVTASTGADISTVAAPIWDIGANFKNQGIRFATFMLLGGTALVGMFLYFVSKDKTQAMKAVAFGIVLVGIINALPALGMVSTDTIKSISNTGGNR